MHTHTYTQFFYLWPLARVKSKALQALLPVVRGEYYTGRKNAITKVWLRRACVRDRQVMVEGQGEREQKKVAG